MRGGTASPKNERNLMAKVFKSPRPPAPPPLLPPDPVLPPPEPQPIAVLPREARPEPDPVPEPLVEPEAEQDPDQARLESIKRRRRSRLSTIYSGARGVMAANDRQPVRKRLLGE